MDPGSSNLEGCCHYTATLLLFWQIRNAAHTVKALPPPAANRLNIPIY
jgi:hypothetical protein